MTHVTTIILNMFLFNSPSLCLCVFVYFILFYSDLRDKYQLNCIFYYTKHVHACMHTRRYQIVTTTNYKRVVRNDMVRLVLGTERLGCWGRNDQG